MCQISFVTSLRGAGSVPGCNATTNRGIPIALGITIVGTFASPGLETGVS